MTAEDEAARLDEVVERLEAMGAPITREDLLRTMASMADHRLRLAKYLQPQPEQPTKGNPTMNLVADINARLRGAASEAQPTKIPNTRANRRAYLTARGHGAGHGVFHRNLTASRKRCVKCADKIASYRTLCYRCETSILLAELARMAGVNSEGLSAFGISAKDVAVSMPRQHR